MTEKSVFETLSPQIIENLAKLNILSPTPVQERIIPLIAQNKSVVFQSETGTGKTFAYLLPLVEKIKADSEKINPQEKTVKVIICAPTFELASQIKQNVMKITDINTALFIGGSPIKRQIETLKEKPQIVIGTAARLVELIRLKKLKVQNIIASVFDEADRLVKKELIAETSALLELLPKNSQKIACSATIDNRTKEFFSVCQVEILPNEDILSKKITHWAIHAESRDKIETLRKFIIAEKPEKALVFTSRADQVENICAKLKFKKIPCEAIHAKTDKQQRQSIIAKFKSGKINTLITSDLSARGLDVPEITHIIQMDLPNDKDFFIHRAGRTARAGSTGINVVIGDEYEMNAYSQLEKKLKIIVYPKQIFSGKIISPQIK